MKPNFQRYKNFYFFIRKVKIIIKVLKIGFKKNFFENYQFYRVW